MYYFQMSTVICEVTDCNIRSSPVMGHKRCAYHCECLAHDNTYDPSRCGHCINFVNTILTKCNDADVLALARSDLNRHIKKLGRYCQSQGVPFSDPSEINRLKKYATPPIDWDSLHAFTIPPLL